MYVCLCVCVLTLVLAQQGRGDPGFWLDHPARGHVLVLHGWWRDHHGNSWQLFNPAGKYCQSKHFDRCVEIVGVWVIVIWRALNPRIHFNTLHPTKSINLEMVGNRPTNQKAPSSLACFFFQILWLWFLRQPTGVQAACLSEVKI